MKQALIKKVRKRDGRIVDFDSSKITVAIHKALNATSHPDGKLAADLTDRVVERLEETAEERPIPTVEQIQDIVERILVDADLPEVAKAYILYRDMRASVRAARKFVGVPLNDIKVSVNAAKVLSQRYLIKNEEGEVVETPGQMFRRVAAAVAAPDQLHSEQADVKATEEKFFNMMANFEFMPNCLARDSIVSTSEGLATISSLEDNMPINIATDNGFSKATRFYSNGFKKVWKITTENGYTITATPLHYFRVINKEGYYIWKQLKDIASNDYMVLQKGFVFTHNIPSLSYSKSEYKGGRPANIYSFPPVLTTELAEFIGYMYGDGCLDDSRVRIFIDDNSMELIDYFKASLREFGLIGKTSKGKGGFELSFNSVNLVGFLRENQLDKASLVTPNKIMVANSKIIAGYLRGLFEADGSVGVSEDRITEIEFSTISEKMANEVQLLLLGLGIKSRRITKKPGTSGYDSDKTQYRILINNYEDICTFRDTVGFISIRKQNKLRDIQCKRSNRIPNQWVKFKKWYHEKDNNYKLYSRVSSNLCWNESVGLATLDKYSTEFPEFQEFVDDLEIHRKQIFEKIKTIEHLELDTVDIEVPNGNTYIANGFVTHNSPTLMNAGTSLGQLAACFVIPVDDSIPAIFDAVKYMAIIHQTGGGTGFSFSRLRPKGDVVRSTKGIASGPVSFMRVFDVATDVIKQGGRRRGANMGILRYDHPDIIEFVTAKKKEGFLTNFNVSVAVADSFMDALSKGEDFNLINPRNGEITGKLSAKYLFDVIVTQAWSTGDPGLFFIDRANTANPTPEVGQFESTNPCVVGSTRISTSRGLATMEELFISQEVFAAVTAIKGKPLETENALLPAVPVFKTGSNEPVFNVETKHGYELTATANHRFLTPNGFVELKDLNPGDTLYLQAGEGCWSENYELPVFMPEHSGARGRYISGINKGKINPPQKWSKELGQLLGWMVGDGFLVSEGSQMIALIFGKDERDFIPYFQELFSNWFGATGFLREQRGSVQLRYKGFPARFLYNLGIATAKSHLKKVPDSIWYAPRDAVIGFLQGLFTTDGTVNISEKKGSCSIRLASSSKELLQEVQLLLLNLGIVSRLHLRREEKEVYLPDSDGQPKLARANKQYELILDKVNRDRFVEVVGFMSRAKQSKAKSFIKSKKRKSNCETFTTMVKSIEAAGFADVYDTTQPLTHTVAYNGIITHQCGEVPLLPYEPCNLGSINLHKMVKADGSIDWDKLRDTVHKSIHFLDNVIDASKYPLPQIDYMAKANRKIGLGVMGFADMLLEMGVPYDSQPGLNVAEEVMKFIHEEAVKKSVELARERGSFPNFLASKWDKAGFETMRNATVTTIAPTGTISIIANASSGIEPIFAVSYAREVMEGTTLLEVNPVFEKVAKERDFYSQELMMEISKQGTIKGILDIPSDIRRVFVTSFDIAPEWHVKMQAVFQKYVDNAVSKTVNLPHDATIEDVRKIYLLAYELGCKGITIYRYGSKPEQVLYIGTPEERKVLKQPITASSEYSGGCAWGYCPL